MLERITVYQVSHYENSFTLFVYCQKWSAWCATVSSGTASAGAAPRRTAGFSKSPALLTELPDTRPDERSCREQPSAGSGQKAATVRTKPPSQQDARSSQRDSVDKDKPSQTSHTHLPSAQVAPQSHEDFVSLCVRGNGLEWNLQGGNSRLESGRLKTPLIQQAPVREGGGQTDWSATSSDSDAALRLPCSGRRVEPLGPFSVSAGTVDKTGGFGGVTPDGSDLTVYKQMPEKTSEDDDHRRKSLDREPIPGSECGRSRPQFSELRQRQQDSGFHSPFHLQQWRRNSRYEDEGLR